MARPPAGSSPRPRRLVIEPPPADWPEPAAARSTLAADHEAAPPPVFSGHQAQLWHPGILAKDLVAAAAAERFHADARHLVVDQDAHAVWRLDVPRQDGDAVTADAVLLAPHRAAAPTGYQPPADPDTLKANLASLPGDAGQRLADAIDHAAASEPATLARQVAAITARLAAAAGDGADPPRVFMTDLARGEAFRDLVLQMTRDPERCVRAYNAEAAKRPEAGIRPLSLTRELIELPLWACRWNQPRREVFVDVSDRRHRLVFEDGTPIGGDSDVLPRALAMTAYLRGGRIAMFVHGLGGGVYDRITEAWWERWRGEALAPSVVATADVVLDFDAPVADRSEVSAARWHRHHAPHNVDVLLGLDAPEVRRKWALLDHMDDDRDKARRSAAYFEIQAINQTLRRAHPGVVAAADRRLARARLGVVNAAVARRRDWPLPLYAPDALAELRSAVRARVLQPCGCGGGEA